MTETIADFAARLSDARGLMRFEAENLGGFDSRKAAVTDRGRALLRSVVALFGTYLNQDDARPRHARAI
jgi:hypothetical protein